MTCLCSGCGVYVDSCFCGLLQPFVTRTRISLLIHRSEINKVTNTGKLANKLLSNSQVRVFGAKHSPLCAEDVFREGYHNVLLYPSTNASLPDLAFQDKPVNVIVPDGNWSQASLMARKIRALAPVQTIGVPMGEASEYKLRSHPDPQKICTIEAIYRALCFLEKEAPSGHLMEMLRIMRDRILDKIGKKL